MPTWLTTENAWFTFGVIGTIIFQGRFYLQWLASEREKKSTVPVSFWYMSSVGTIILLAYAVYKKEPVGVLGQGLNMVIYSRNLVHIWRDRGTLTPRVKYGIQGFAAIVGLISLGFVAWVWMHNIDTQHEKSDGFWLWVGLGVLGQAMFGCRFIVQWLATERAKKSVMPAAFWYISLAACILSLLSYVPRSEWVFALGQFAILPIYLRNIWFIHQHRNGDEGETGIA